MRVYSIWRSRQRSPMTDGEAGDARLIVASRPRIRPTRHSDASRALRISNNADTILQFEEQSCGLRNQCLTSRHRAEATCDGALSNIGRIGLPTEDETVVSGPACRDILHADDGDQARAAHAGFFNTRRLREDPSDDTLETDPRHRGCTLAFDASDFFDPAGRKEVPLG